MQTPPRPDFLHYLVIRGDLSNALIALLPPVYGIKLKTTSIGVEPRDHTQVLVIDYKRDTIYLTEEGSLIGQWKAFNYPEQKEELLKELCYESKRRFESSTTSFSWGSGD